MKTATVADLRNNFAEVSQWISDGESVTITKRGRPFARLNPLKPNKKGSALTWPDRAARLSEIFPIGPLNSDIQDVIDYNRGNT